jgi:hypothetical protein
MKSGDPMTLRVYLLQVAPQSSAEMPLLVEDMKDAGFKFDRETCPITLAPRWGIVRVPDGVLFWQADAAAPVPDEQTIKAAAEEVT